MTNLKKLKLTGLWICVMSIFISELLFYTWCRVQNVRYGYEISSEINDRNKLKAYQNNLKIELARLKSPERIACIAREQLGLMTPTAKKTILMP